VLKLRLTFWFLLALAAILLSEGAAGGASYLHEKWRLPWADWTSGAQMYVTTAYGQGEHVGCLNYYALDFASGDYPYASWPIVATANGNITAASYNSDAGNYIEVTHDDGSSVSHYAHLIAFAFTRATWSRAR